MQYKLLEESGAILGTCDAPAKGNADHYGRSIYGKRFARAVLAGASVTESKSFPIEIREATPKPPAKPVANLRESWRKRYLAMNYSEVDARHLAELATPETGRSADPKKAWSSYYRRLGRLPAEADRMAELAVLG